MDEGNSSVRESSVFNLKIGVGKCLGGKTPNGSVALAFYRVLRPIDVERSNLLKSGISKFTRSIHRSILKRRRD